MLPKFSVFIYASVICISGLLGQVSFAGVSVGDWELLDFTFEDERSCHLSHESRIWGYVIEINKGTRGPEVMFARRRGFGDLEGLSGVPVYVDNGQSEKKIYASFVLRDRSDFDSKGYSRLVFGDHNPGDIYFNTQDAFPFLEHISSNKEFTINVYHRTKGKRVLFEFDLDGTEYVTELFRNCYYNY